MQDYLIIASHFLVNALVIMGVYNVFREGQLLWPIHNWLINRAKTPKGKEKNKEILMPFIRCFVCMPSIWGSAFYLYMMFELGLSFWGLPVYVLALSGFMYMVKIQFFE